MLANEKDMLELTNKLVWVHPRTASELSHMACLTKDLDVKLAALVKTQEK